jgi:hypothetical protein
VDTPDTGSDAGFDVDLDTIDVPDMSDADGGDDSDLPDISDDVPDIDDVDPFDVPIDAFDTGGDECVIDEECPDGYICSAGGCVIDLG